MNDVMGHVHTYLSYIQNLKYKPSHQQVNQPRCQRFQWIFFQALAMGIWWSNGQVYFVRHTLLLLKSKGVISILKGRFGTYTLGSNYPKVVDQSIYLNGYNTDMGLCSGFDDKSYIIGLPTSFIDQIV